MTLCWYLCISHVVCNSLTGTRIRSTFDFGLVTLTVNGLRPDDSAIYTCKATNLLGEAVSTCTLKVEGSNRNDRIRFLTGYIMTVLGKYILKISNNTGEYNYMKHHQMLLIKVKSVFLVATVFKLVDLVNKVITISGRNLKLLTRSVGQFLVHFVT